MALTKLLSVLIFALILCGVALRRSRRTHATIMLSAMAADLGLVLYLEITRNAVNTALHPPHPFILFHVTLSIGVVVAYLLQAGMGIRMLKTRRRIPAHRWVAILFLVFRFGNLTTSFFVDQFKEQVVTQASQAMPATLEPGNGALARLPQSRNPL